jgi:histidine triad (HIT) family protein
MQADCTFCQIVSGELPADLVDEDERTVAFMDISPATLGHVLVVPRRHVPDVLSADPGDWLAVAAMARRMARWVRGAFGAGGVDLVQANSDGSVGNQTVFHLHVHVLPRRPARLLVVAADGRPGRDHRGRPPPGRVRPPRPRVLPAPGLGRPLTAPGRPVRLGCLCPVRMFASWLERDSGQGLRGKDNPWTQACSSPSSS